MALLSGGCRPLGAGGGGWEWAGMGGADPPTVLFISKPPGREVNEFIEKSTDIV